MPIFHYPSIIATGLLILSFVSLIVFLATVASGRGRLVVWSIGNLAFISSRILFAFQPSLPPLVGVILANVLAFGAMACFADASILLLSGKPPRLFMTLLGATLAAILAAFTWILPSTFVRIVVLSLGVACLALAAGAILFRLSKREKIRHYPGIIAALFVTYGLAFLARAVWYLAEGKSLIDTGTMAHDLAFSIETFFTVTMLVSLNFLLLVTLMVRLEREITGKVLELGQSHNELQILYNAFLDTAGTISFDELLPRILELLVRDLHARTAAIHLVEEPSGELSLLAQRGYDSKAIALLHHPPKGASVSSEAFQRREALVWTLADYPEGEIRETIAAQGISIVGGFPIAARGEILGSLTIGYEKEEALDAARSALIGTLSLQLGIVIRAARLHEELDRANARLDVLAGTDSLTGLANRRTAQAELARETARAQRARGNLAVIMCDIDHFKDFNDRWGHDYGDYVLKTVAAAIAETARATDHAARWGGEEFLVILGDADTEGVEVLAERIRQRVEALTLDCGGQSTKVTLTLGAAVCPAERGGEAAVAVADEALYEGKRNGRNRVVFRTCDCDRS